MGVRSVTSWRPFVRVFGDVYLCGLVVGNGGAPVLLDHTASFVGVFFAHQNDSTSHARKHVLNGIHGREIGVDPSRFEQPFDDEGFRSLLRVEHLYQLFVWIGTPRHGHGTFCHNSSSGGRFGEFCLSRGVSADPIVTLRSRFGTVPAAGRFSEAMVGLRFPPDGPFVWPALALPRELLSATTAVTMRITGVR